MTIRDGNVIDPDVEARIQAELDKIERAHGVEIILAVESGSRAWGFPSPDSDYDVRFLYVRPAEAYLSVMPRRDVIERPIDATLDMNGWDLRKAMQLLARSNAVLIEWLTSPIRYRDTGALPTELLGLAVACADIAALAYHYDRLARRSFDSVLAGMDNVRLKTYCYALRAALALGWLRTHGTPPPMDLPELLRGLDLSAAVTGTVEALVARKATALEAATTKSLAELDALIGAALSVPAPRPALLDRVETVARLDAAFAGIILGRLGAAKQ